MRQRRKPRAAQLGVTDAEYDRLLAAQGGGCAICGNPPKTRRLHVDHDHKTGRVRGLLCHRCNRALPNWVTAEWLLSAAGYIGGIDGLDGSTPGPWEYRVSGDAVYLDGPSASDPVRGIAASIHSEIDEANFALIVALVNGVRQ